MQSRGGRGRAPRGGWRRGRGREQESAPPSPVPVPPRQQDVRQAPAAAESAPTPREQHRPAGAPTPERPQEHAAALKGLHLAESSSSASQARATVQHAESSSPAAASQARVSSKALVPVLRPNVGVSGRRVQLRTNHFKVNYANVQLFHYDVAINPEVTKTLNRAAIRQLVTLYKSELGSRLPVYDGRKNLYTAGPLPFQSQEFHVSLPDDPNRKFKVSIKLVNQLDNYQMDLFLRGRHLELPQAFVSALDIALRESSTQRFFPSARSFFSQEFGRQPMEGGYEAWKGFYQSLRPTSQGLALNIDLSAAVFYEPVAVIEFLRKALQLDPRRRMTDIDRRKAKRLLYRVQIQVTHRDTPRRYRITDLSSEPTRNLRFPLDDGSEMSIIDYFRRTYGYTISYPELPCLRLQGSKASYLPMEVCKIRPGQKYNGKLDEKQRTTILKFTCQAPADRDCQLASVLQNVHGAGRNPYAAEFGLAVEPRMTEVTGRILPPPKLKYLRSQEVYPKKGEWNMLDSMFYEPASLNSWAIVNLASAGDREVENFAYELMNRCREIGMQVQPPVQGPFNGAMEGFENVIKRAVSNRKLELIVVLMAAKHPLYGDLKRVCETEIGVVTQCCLRRHIAGEPRKLSQYLANLAMKINVKLGGKNVTLSLEMPRLLPQHLNVPTIIFGADVTHATGDMNSPSIAAVVGSVDWPSATKYLCRARAQAPRMERIEQLGAMVKELLIEFYKGTQGMKPHKILFFRDGVGEGQFNDVLQHELSAIYRACLSIEADYQPRVTFVVVQKRHHTRFFPTDNNVEKNNVMPGTVVDTVITHPSQFDFYLCSHKGLQGTSRPAHYHVLHDDNKFKADELQMLINNLCYTYARCTKAVSIVPPAYYAHLVAYRARLYLEEGSDGMSATTGGAGGYRDIRPVLDSVRKVMFYC